MRNSIYHILFCCLAALAASCSSMIDDAGTVSAADDAGTVSETDDAGTVSTDDDPAISDSGDQDNTYTISGMVANAPGNIEYTVLIDNRTVLHCSGEARFIINDISPGEYCVSVTSHDYIITPECIDVTVGEDGSLQPVFMVTDHTWSAAPASDYESRINSVCYDERTGLFIAAGYEQAAEKGKEITVGAYTEDETIWQKRFGGNSSDTAVKIVPYGSDSYVLLCNRVTPHPDTGIDCENIYLYILSSEGEKADEIVYGGSLSDTGHDLLVTDGSFIVAGSTSSHAKHGGTDALLVMIDHSGTVVWEKVFGSTGDDAASALCIFSDNYALASSIYDDASGITQTRVDIFTVSGETEESGIFHDIRHTRPYAIKAHNGYLFAALTVGERTLRGSDGKILKLESDLSLSHSSYIGSVYDDSLMDMCITPGGDLFVCGFTTKGYGLRDRDSYIVLLNSDLAVINEEVFSDNSVNDELYSLSPLPSGGCVAGGYMEQGTAAQKYLMSLNQDGAL